MNNKKPLLPTEALITLADKGSRNAIYGMFKYIKSLFKEDADERLLNLLIWVVALNLIAFLVYLIVSFGI